MCCQQLNLPPRAFEKLAQTRNKCLFCFFIVIIGCNAAFCVSSTIPVESNCFVSLHSAIESLEKPFLDTMPDLQDFRFQFWNFFEFWSKAKIASRSGFDSATQQCQITAESLSLQSGVSRASNPSADYQDNETSDSSAKYHH